MISVACFLSRREGIRIYTVMQAVAAAGGGRGQEGEQSILCSGALIYFLRYWKANELQYSEEGGK